MLEVVFNGMGSHASIRPGQSVVYDRDGYRPLREGGYIVLKRATVGLSSFGDYYVLTDRGADLERRYRLEVRKLGSSARFVPDVVTKAKAADKRYGYFRPDDVFTIDAIHLEPEGRKKIADKILEKADDPYVSITGGRIKVAPSKGSYFGDELFVAIREALHRPHRFEPGRNTFVLL